MAKDFDKNNENLEDKLTYADLDYDSDYDEGEIEIVENTIFTGITDYIVHEIRNNPVFEDIFRTANDAKNEMMEAKKASLGESDNEASDIIIKNSAELNKAEYELEKALGKSVEKINYFEYDIGGLELRKEDLSLINARREDYETCLEDARRMKRSIKRIGKEIGKLKLAKVFSLRSYRFSNEEERLDYLKDEKKEKLAADEAFLKKYCFIKEEVSTENYALLSKFFAKSELLGIALTTLEQNNKEQIKMESRDGQVALLKEAFKDSIAPEDYEALISFIDATREKVKAKDYDSSGIQTDRSELGKIIKWFVVDLERTKNDTKSIEEMMEKFEQLNAAMGEKERVDVQPLEFEHVSDEEFKKAKLHSTIEMVEQPDASEKDTENNMIVTLVLESGKYRKIIEAIREREKDLYAEKRVKIRHKLAEKSKSQRLAEKYIQTDKAELAGLLELPIQVEEDGCFIGDRFFIPEDVNLATISEKQYAELLDKLDEIKRDKKGIDKDIKKNRKEARKSYSYDRGYWADVELYQMKLARDEAADAEQGTKNEIKIAEFFGNLGQEELHRTILFLGAIGEAMDAKTQIDELKEQEIKLANEEDSVRKPIMHKALLELVKEGVVTKDMHKELVKYIREYQKGFEDGTYVRKDGYERDNSELGQVVYDYIDLINNNIDKVKKGEEQEQAQLHIQFNKDKDDDGDIEI